MHRFGAPAQLCSWAGLTPKHHESDSTVRRGHITKQGSRLVRWAAVEAAQKLPADSRLRADRDRVAGRRGKNIGKVAAARNCSPSSTTACVTATSAALAKAAA